MVTLLEGNEGGSYTGRRTDPAKAVRPITVGGLDIPEGPCRGLWSSGDGVITFIDHTGYTAENFPVMKGQNPIGAKRVTASNVASLWALY